MLARQRALREDFLKDLPADVRQASINEIAVARENTRALLDELIAIRAELRRIRMAA
jgi:hypothetical protein